MKLKINHGTVRLLPILLSINLVTLGSAFVVMSSNAVSSFAGIEIPKEDFTKLKDSASDGLACILLGMIIPVISAFSVKREEK